MKHRKLAHQVGDLCMFQIRPRMANHAISWVLDAHVRFDDLDFIVTLGGELALAHTIVQSLPSVSFNYGRLER